MRGARSDIRFVTRVSVSSDRCGCAWSARYAFVGFGSAWAEGTTSVVKVDLERMVRVAAIITREGQTWLYTGLGYKDWAFFGTRGTAETKHAGAVARGPPMGRGLRAREGAGRNSARLEWGGLEGEGEGRGG